MYYLNVPIRVLKKIRLWFLFRRFLILALALYTVQVQLYGTFAASPRLNM